MAGEPVLDADINFPALERFLPATQLPTLGSIIGRLRYLSSGGKRNWSHDQAILQVTVEVESKYYHDTVYCQHTKTILKK